MPNFGKNGIKASELIRKLQSLVEMNGDYEVHAGGTDYPEGVTFVELRDPHGAAFTSEPVYYLS